MTILRMKPTIQDNFLSFTDVLEVTFDSHTLNGNYEVNRQRHQANLGWLISSTVWVPKIVKTS